MTISSSKLNLEKIEVKRSDITVYEIRQECTVKHSNGKTTLDHPVAFVKDHRGWGVEFSIQDMPVQENINEASNKLGDWLIRLGTALKECNPEKIDLDTINVTCKPFNSKD